MNLNETVLTVMPLATEGDNSGRNEYHETSGTCFQRVGSRVDYKSLM